MKRFLLFVALLSTCSASAATISSSTCPGTGCSVSFVTDTTALAIQVTGAWSGSIAVELSNDNVVFVPARAYPVGGGPSTAAFTTNGGWMMPTGGMAYFRVRATSWVSGTATVTTRPTPSTVAADVVRAVGTDFGGVVLAVPDGGHPVNLGPATVNTVVTTPDGGLPVLVTNSVTVASDGGLGVVIRGPFVETTDGGSALAVSAPDVVRVVGPTFGAVDITGTVNAHLTDTTLTALDPPCTFVAAPPRTTLTTTPVDVPATPLTGRTQMLVLNLSISQEVWCCRGVACTPTSAAAYVIRANGAQTWDGIRDTDIIRCRAQAGTADINAQEASCG